MCLSPLLLPSSLSGSNKHFISRYTDRTIRIRVKEQTENHGSREHVAASVIMTSSMMQEMFMSDPIIQDLVTNIIQLSPMGHHDDKQKQHKLTFLTQCIELFFMAAGPGSSADVIGFELPLLCGSVYSTTNTTPNSKAVDFFKGSVGSTTLLYLLITWITLLVISKIMEQLKGCDDVTKAFVLATMKDKAEGYTPRYFQHQMVGGLQTIATDAVTTCPTYTKLLEVLDSDDFDAEKKIKQILALLSTTNEESEWKSPYDSSSRTTYRGRQIPSNISSIRLSQRGRRFARLQMRTWFTLWKQSTPSIFPTKFSSISLHPQSASSIRIHTTFLLDSIGLRWVKSILMMWFKTSISM